MIISIFLSMICIAFAHEFFFKDITEKLDLENKE